MGCWTTIINFCGSKTEKEFETQTLMLTLQENWQLLQLSNAKLTLAVGQAIRADYKNSSSIAVIHFDEAIQLKNQLLAHLNDFAQTLINIQKFLPGNLREEFVEVSTSISEKWLKEKSTATEQGLEISKIASREESESIIEVFSLLKDQSLELETLFISLFSELENARPLVENGQLYDTLMVKSLLEENRIHPFLLADRESSDAILSLGVSINKFSELTNQTALESNISYRECSHVA